MKISFALTASLLFPLSAFGCKATKDMPEESTEPPIPEMTWKSFSNSFVEFSYPNNWLLTLRKRDSDEELDFVLTHPAFKDSPPSPLDIYFSNDPLKPGAKLLRETVHDFLTDEQKEGARITQKPQSLILGDGRCFYWATEKQTDHMCEMPDGRQGPCFDSWLVSECRAFDQRRVAIIQHLYPHPLPGRLDEKFGVGQKKVYERLLRSIKFKKPEST